MKPGFYCTNCGALIEAQRIDGEVVYENCYCGQFPVNAHPDDVGWDEDYENDEDED